VKLQMQGFVGIFKDFDSVLLNECDIHIHEHLFILANQSVGIHTPFAVGYSRFFMGDWRAVMDDLRE